MSKAERSRFLAQNPFPRPYTLGFYYREKMRAIHEVTPDGEYKSVLELGGGASGLTSLLFPSAKVINLEMDALHGRKDANRNGRQSFVCGDAVRLPFPNACFDAVTLFDVLEHIPDDAAAAAEAFRVTRPNGVVLISAPNERWRFPYYAPLRNICPGEEHVMAEWGHVRRGYSISDLAQLSGFTCEKRFDFINRFTVISHDVAFSNLPGPFRRASCAALWPITYTAYLLHGPETQGTETATCWRKSNQTR